jgi:TDG/mug DNA glycosylase family protein
VTPGVPARRGRAAPPTLPDYLRPGLDLVLVGINPGLYSARQGHYFARPTSRFWPAFSRSTLSLPVRRTLRRPVLGPDDDARLLACGIGMTDLVKTPTANAADLTARQLRDGARRLLAVLQRDQPRVACFHGLTAYRPFARHALAAPGDPASLGAQPLRVGSTRLFVAPNPSPANAHFRPADYVAWYDRLAEFLWEPPR